MILSLQCFTYYDTCLQLSILLKSCILCQYYLLLPSEDVNLVFERLQGTVNCIIRLYDLFKLKDINVFKESFCSLMTLCLTKLTNSEEPWDNLGTGRIFLIQSIVNVSYYSVLTRMWSYELARCGIALVLKWYSWPIVHLSYYDVIHVMRP